MTIHQFGRALKEGGGIGLKDCPSLKGLLETDWMRRARRAFSQKFPKAERVRHSIAHSGQTIESREDFDANAFSGQMDYPGIIKADGRGIMIQDSMAGRRYMATHAGEVVSYELSAETLDLLCEIAKEFYRAFEPVQLLPAEVRELMAAAAKSQ